MAWCHRTTREQNKCGFVASATTRIGPGSYDIVPTMKLKPNYAPFGSTNGRSSTSNPATPGLVTPGPGSYHSHNVDRDGNVDLPSSAFRSTTKRTDSSSSGKSPGPGTYTLVNNFVSKKARYFYQPSSVRTSLI